MNTPRGGSFAFGAVLALSALMASTAYAAGPHGGGGGGGGGHGSSGGGGHSFAGAHVSAAHFGGAHYAAAGGFHGAYSAGAVRSSPGYSYAHATPTAGRAIAGGYGHGTTAYVAGRGGYGYARGGYARWGGGYWHGGYWPPVFWGAGFAWFLPVLPAFCATYYWNSIPYYYYNDVYYTYDPSASGYVVTTPPPASDAEGGAGDSDGAGPAAAIGAAAAAPASGAGPVNSQGNSDGLYAYPKNGQSDEQQASDRRECGQWAGSQTGGGGGPDYRRALTACLQGRGYSVD